MSDRKKKKGSKKFKKIGRVMFVGRSSSLHPGLPTAQEEVVNSTLTLIPIPFSSLPSAQPLLQEMFSIKSR